ncbi:MAG: tyrosine-type recombinase/integrase [Acidimicrobiales bacterium]
MTTLATLLESFFTKRLMTERQASPETIASYRATFCLLLRFAEGRLGKSPSQLEIADLDAPFIGAFLEHLEHERHNSATTRNARLAAIRSLFRYAAWRVPEQAAVVQRVLAMSGPRTQRPVVTFLTDDEVGALLSAPDLASWTGRRDRALLTIAVQTGLRVSELTGLSCGQVHLSIGPHVRCVGKGRKERCTPLTAASVMVLKSWLREQPGGSADPLFPSRRGGSLSADAVQALVAKYVEGAMEDCPSMRAKRVTPHTLRHTAAMRLLRAGVDTSVIALWLGHERTETTQVYLHADLGIKERALARTAPIDISPGRYRPTDPLLAFLEAL